MNPRPLPRQGSALPLSYVPMIKAYTKYARGKKIKTRFIVAGIENLEKFDKMNMHCIALDQYHENFG